MSLFKRPLAAVGLSGFCMLVACALLPFSASVIVAVGCAVIAIICLFRRNTRRVAVCFFAALIAGGSFLLTEASFYRPLQSYDGKTVALHGTVTDTEGIAHGVLTVTVRVDSGTLPSGTKVLLRTPFNDLPPVYGDEIVATAAVERLSDTLSKRTLFDSRKAHRIVLSGWVERENNFSLFRKDERSFSKNVALFRDATSNALLSGMTEDVRPLLCAMCLGNKSFLNNETLVAFRRSGVSHLLVVSGLHVSIVAFGVFGLLRKWRVGRKRASLVALATLFIFALLVGFHPSVVRACVLNALVLSGNLFRRRADGLNSLGGGLLLLWLVDPYCVYDVGLWMSFGATLGLLWLLPQMMRPATAWVDRRFQGKLQRPMRAVVSSLCVTLSATLPILPICVFVFGEVSLIAPLTNLLAVFAATLFLWCATAALLLSVLHLGFFAGAFRLCATLLARYLLWVTALLGGFEGAVVYTDSLVKQVTLVVVTAVAVLFCRRWGKRGAIWAAGLCAVVLCAVTVVTAATEKGKTHVIVERAFGDNAALILQENRSVLLVDGGNGWTAATTLLEQNHLEAVDAVILTDANRKLTRKWLEFADSAAVGTYVIAGKGNACLAALEERHAPVSALSDLALDYNGEITAENGAILLTIHGETVAFCENEAALLPTMQATHTVFADETEDVSFVIS